MVWNNELHCWWGNCRFLFSCDVNLSEWGLMGIYKKPVCSVLSDWAGNPRFWWISVEYEDDYTYFSDNAHFRKWSFSSQQQISESWTEPVSLSLFNPDFPFGSQYSWQSNAVMQLSKSAVPRQAGSRTARIPSTPAAWTWKPAGSGSGVEAGIKNIYRDNPTLEDRVT